MGSKKPTVGATAHLVQGGQEGPQILLEGLQGVQLEDGQVQFIRQQVFVFCRRNDWKTFCAEDGQGAGESSSSCRASRRDSTHQGALLSQLFCYF